MKSRKPLVFLAFWAALILLLNLAACDFPAATPSPTPAMAATTVPSPTPAQAATKVVPASSFVPFANSDCPTEGFPVALNQTTGGANQLSCQYFTQGMDITITLNITYSANAADAKNSYTQKRSLPNSGLGQPCSPDNNALKIDTATQLLCLYSETSITDKSLIQNSGWGVQIYKDAFLIEETFSGIGSMTGAEAAGCMKNMVTLATNIIDKHSH